MTQPAIAGSRTFVGPAGGGEGPWIASSWNMITIDGVTGDRWIVWANNATPPTLSGPAVYQDASVLFGAQVWIIHFTGDGTLTIGDSCLYWRFLIHRAASPITIGNISTVWT
jgi:hypothetical protein